MMHAMGHRPASREELRLLDLAWDDFRRRLSDGDPDSGFY